MVRDHLVNILADMMDEVKSGDSHGGSIEYEMQEDGSFLVRGSYRVGNSLGQGGVRLIMAISEGG